VAQDAVPYGARSPLSVFWSRFRRNRLAVAALAFLAAIHLVAVTADVLAPYDPSALDLLNQFASPSTANLLGTDESGRDVLSRLIVGAYFLPGEAGSVALSFARPGYSKFTGRLPAGQVT